MGRKDKARLVIFVMIVKIKSMLTNNDFQQIKTIVREETRKIAQEETRKIVQEETRTIVQEETRTIVREETADLKRDFKTIKNDVARMRTDIKAIVSFFDSEYLGLRKRVDRLEEHLRLPPLQ